MRSKSTNAHRSTVQIREICYNKTMFCNEQCHAINASNNQVVKTSS